MLRTTRAHSTLLTLLFTAVSGPLAGCGVLDGLPSREARCDLRPQKDQCTDLRDYKGGSFVTFEGVCSTLRAAQSGGSFKEDARCDTTGAVGGCQAHNGDGSLQTNWYYADSHYRTEDDVRAECSTLQSFVPPDP